MQQDFDKYNLAERAAITLCNPDKSELHSLGSAYNTQIIVRFNAMQEFSFTFPESVDGGVTQLEAYYFLNNKRLILVDGFGYFQIVNVEEIMEGHANVKQVKCMSLENELISKRVTQFGGTRPLYNILSPENTVLKEMSDLCGGLWTVGTVDSSLMTKQRTFDTKDSTIYDFLMNDVSKAFECVFYFDTILRTISAKAVSSATVQTDIFLSFDNVIKSASFSEKSDEITTVLSVKGGADLSIAPVNPLGTSKIYDFSYYKNPNWMSSNLVAAITAWEQTVDNYQPVYATNLLYVEQYNSDLLTLQAELATLNAERLALEGVQKARIQQNVSYADIYAQIGAKDLQIRDKGNEIAAKQAQIATTTAYLQSINEAVSFETNFTPEQLVSLQSFMFENSYLNSNIIKTDSMTLVQIQQAEQQLYDQAKNVLSKISQPRYEFTLDSVNYIAIPEFKTTFTVQTEPGCVVTAELQEGVFIETVLLELEFGFDDPSNFKMTFSNRLRLDNGGYSYSDLLGEIRRTGSSVAFDEAKWANWENNYKGSVTEFITSALNTATNELINSDNQEIKINQNGLRGKTYIPESQTYDTHEVWLTSSILAFSDDNFATSRLALGKIMLNDQEKFGLVADAIVGEMIIGSNLLVSNENNTFIVDGNGATLLNASFTVISESTDVKVVIDPAGDGGTPEQILSISKKVGGVYNLMFGVDTSGNLTIRDAKLSVTSTSNNAIIGIDPSGIGSPAQVFYIAKNNGSSFDLVFGADVDGNITIVGDVTATSGHIGSLVIDSNGLKTEDGVNYLRGNGNLHWGALDITGSTATFSGNIYANNLKDSTDSPVFSSDLMSGNYIYSGALTGPGGIEIGIGTTGLATIRADTGIEIKVNGSDQVVTVVNGGSFTGVLIGGDNVGITTNTGDITLLSADDIQLTGQDIHFSAGGFTIFDTGISISGGDISVSANGKIATSDIFHQGGFDGVTEDLLIGAVTLHFHGGIYTGHT